MITVVYFASIRERLGSDGEELALAADIDTVEKLVQQLAARGEPWAAVMKDEKLMVAVNQEMSRMETALKDGDEVAFFPPVTGG